MKQEKTYPLAWFFGPVERGFWRLVRGMYPRYEFAGVEIFDLRAQDGDSSDVRQAAVEALEQIRYAGGDAYLESVVTELAFIAAVVRNERISENLRGYFWLFSGRRAANPTRLALGIVGAAGYLRHARQAREAGASLDVAAAIGDGHSLQRDFARLLPNADMWLTEVDRWQERNGL